jgi:hypothetical protein
MGGERTASLIEEYSNLEEEYRRRKDCFIVPRIQ